MDVRYLGLCSAVVKGETDLPSATSAYSLVTALDVTVVSPLGANPHPPGPNALFSILRYLISGRYIMPSGLISISWGSMGAMRAFAASGLKASVDSPWNDLAQSTWRSPSSKITGSSDIPSERSEVTGTFELETCLIRMGHFKKVTKWESTWGTAACWDCCSR